MSIRKPLYLAGLLSIVALSACSDITAPQPTGVCTITGGPGTCEGTGGMTQKPAN